MRVMCVYVYLCTLGINSVPGVCCSLFFMYISTHVYCGCQIEVGSSTCTRGSLRNFFVVVVVLTCICRLVVRMFRELRYSAIHKIIVFNDDSWRFSKRQTFVNVHSRNVYERMRGIQFSNVCCTITCNGNTHRGTFLTRTIR